MGVFYGEEEFLIVLKFIKLGIVDGDYLKIIKRMGELFYRFGDIYVYIKFDNLLFYDLILYKLKENL